MGAPTKGRAVTLGLRWIEDAEKRPRRRQVDLFPATQHLCCAEVARLQGWSWHRAARAIRRAMAMPTGASMRDVRVPGAALPAITPAVQD